MAIRNPKLNLDHDLARALHRVVRAMHDGECPRCHEVYASERMRLIDHEFPTGGKLRSEMPITFSGWRCPNCDFRITDEEAAEVFRIFGPFMEQNLDFFTEWQYSRNKEPDQQIKHAVKKHDEHLTHILATLREWPEQWYEALQDPRFDKKFMRSIGRLINLVDKYIDQPRVDEENRKLRDGRSKSKEGSRQAARAIGNGDSAAT